MDRKSFKAFIAGGLLGFLAGVLFAPKKGEETRKELQEKIEEFKKLLREKEVDKKIEKIFGEVTQATKEAYFAAQMAVVEGLAEVKGALSELEAEKYAALVKEKLEKVKEKLNLDEKVVERLRERFEKERKRLQQAAEKLLKSKGKKGKSKSSSSRRK